MTQTQSKDSAHDLGWWLTVLTAQPLCLYYFGSFTTRQEAESLQAEFIEDLHQENALILCASLRFVQPRQVTVTGSDLLSHIIGFQKIPQARSVARKLA